eukprot:4548512-Prymnesium_polylepis.3
MQASHAAIRTPQAGVVGHLRQAWHAAMHVDAPRRQLRVLHTARACEAPQTSMGVRGRVSSNGLILPCAQPHGRRRLEFGNCLQQAQGAVNCPKLGCGRLARLLSSLLSTSMCPSRETARGRLPTTRMWRSVGADAGGTSAVVRSQSSSYCQCRPFEALGARSSRDLKPSSCACDRPATVPSQIHTAPPLCWPTPCERNGSAMSNCSAMSKGQTDVEAFIKKLGEAAHRPQLAHRFLQSSVVYRKGQARLDGAGRKHRPLGANRIVQIARVHHRALLRSPRTQLRPCILLTPPRSHQRAVAWSILQPTGVAFIVNCSHVGSEWAHAGKRLGALDVPPLPAHAAQCARAVHRRLCRRVGQTTAHLKAAVAHRTLDVQASPLHGQRLQKDHTLQLRLAFCRGTHHLQVARAREDHTALHDVVRNERVQRSGGG